MAVAYLNKTIEIPNVRAQKLDHEIVADSARTAGGKLRRDIVAAKRKWQLECVRLTNAQYRAIIDHLNEIMFGATLFWLDELGGTADTHSIAVYVDITNDERVQFGRNGVWHNNGRNLTLVVTEQ